MKVSELISRLESMDRSMELICFCDDEGSRQRRRPFKVYAVERVDVSPMTQSRDKDLSPRVAFDRRGAERVAVVQITSDF